MMKLAVVIENTSMYRTSMCCRGRIVIAHIHIQQHIIPHVTHLHVLMQLSTPYFDCCQKTNHEFKFTVFTEKRGGVLIAKASSRTTL